MSSLDNMPPRQLPVNENEGFKFLKLRYLERMALTHNAERFEDIERAARKIFKIEDGVSITISVDVPFIDTERMEIDPDICPMISGEVSLAWVTKHPDCTPSPISGSTTEEVFHQMSQSDPDARSIQCALMNTFGGLFGGLNNLPFAVIVHRNATFYDLKQAICKLKPELSVQGLHVADSCLNSHRHRHIDSCRAPDNRCEFFYNPACTPIP
ncbi:hypothetical protein M408DRAFT_304814 [Serendipita vermifera MAFF 305830]|uniref:Uncharacterized protein n=1 Tax=Serendipita vermifera MAFF 305830 TaxID=933852 RepID=A0A0C3BCL8_SERVB|nr:hypothetical protein M408DRAFT_304814 [Serendipita vermifera MAFF 305830]